MTAKTNDLISERRQVLLRTAERLFATRGIDAVSLNEINKAAGQRNTSALHYHFGNKQGLLDAILYQEFDSIVAALNDHLDSLEQQGDFSGQELVAAVAKPFIAMLDSERGSHYLQIMAQLLDRDANMPYLDQPAPVEAVRDRALALAERFFGDLPLAIRINRLILFSTLLFRALVSYLQLSRTPAASVMGGQALFAQVLIESLERLVFAPGSAESLSLATSTGSPPPP